MTQITSLRAKGAQHTEKEDFKPAARCFQTATNFLMAILPSVKKMTSKEKELLSQLSCECADAKMRYADQLGRTGDFVSAANYFQQTEDSVNIQLENFKSAKRRFQALERDSKGMWQSNLAASSGRAKRVGPRIPRNEMKPTCLSKMTLDHTHFGYFIQGTIVEDAFFTGSASFLLLDQEGAQERVSVYGTGVNNTSSAARLFSGGTEIRIYEPYFKRALDGGTAIRVDDFSDVEFVTGKSDQQLASEAELQRLSGAAKEKKKKMEETLRQQQPQQAPSADSDWLTHLNQSSKSKGRGKGRGRGKGKGKAPAPKKAPEPKQEKEWQMLRGGEVEGNKEANAFKQTECPVCQEGFGGELADEWVVSLPKCRHLICVRDLFQMKKKKGAECPLDRKPVSGEVLEGILQEVLQDPVLKDLYQLLPFSPKEREEIVRKLLLNHRFDSCLVHETLWDMVMMQPPPSELSQSPPPSSPSPPSSVSSSSSEFLEEGKDLTPEQKSAIYAEERKKVDDLWVKLKEQRAVLRELYYEGTVEIKSAHQKYAKLQKEVKKASKRCLDRIFHRINTQQGMARQNPNQPLEWDFHGLHQDEVVTKFQEVVAPVLPFLKKAKIITGRGAHSKEGKGVIGNVLKEYIESNEEILWEKVDGNEGAIWVMAKSQQQQSRQGGGKGKARSKRRR